MYIDYDVADSIATITLNRPEAANAQNSELLDELDAAWTRAADDREVKVIVLRANGSTSPRAMTCAAVGRCRTRSRWNSSSSTSRGAIWNTR